MKQSDIKIMAINLSERHGIKLSRSDDFNKLTPQLQGKVRKEVYNSKYKSSFLID